MTDDLLALQSELASYLIERGWEFRGPKVNYVLTVRVPYDNNLFGYVLATVGMQAIKKTIEGTLPPDADFISVSLDPKCAKELVSDIWNWIEHKRAEKTESIDFTNSAEEIVESLLDEKEKKVRLNKIMPGDVSKYKVYVKNPKGNVVKVNFGDKSMEIKRDNPERRKSFRARHHCDTPGPKYKARYWACKTWSNTPVSELLKGK